MNKVTFRQLQRLPSKKLIPLLPVQVTINREAVLLIEKLKGGQYV